jgi:serine/threonine protein kinase
MTLLFFFFSSIKFICYSRVKPDDFEFRTCIGKGSFGKVYLARHKSEDTIYAVKVVSKALIKRKREERHIMAERDVLVKNTRHPFLVSLQYSFQTPDKLYFVMDFVNGGEVCIFISSSFVMTIDFV